MKRTKERDFKGIWIPKELYLDTSLTWTEKILLLEITSLDKGEGCYAGTKHLADHAMVSVAQCNRSLKTLSEKGLITIKEEGRSRTFCSHLGAWMRRDGRMNASSQRMDASSLDTNSPEEGSVQPKIEDEPSANNTYNNTVNSISTDEKEKFQLQQVLGKTPLIRLCTVYALMWLDTFGTKYTIDYGLFTKALQPLLKIGLTEWQVAALIVCHFQWHGTTGQDDYAQKNLENNGYPVFWIKTKMNEYSTYMTNVLAVNFEDNDAVREFVRENTREPYLEAVKLGIIKLPETKPSK